jgi:uncharacterized protein YjlB
MDVETHHFEDDGGIPNSPLPVLVYRGVEALRDARSCEALFASHGWLGAWRDGIFSFHHFHSTAHEVLGVVAGRADVVLGGPRGRRFEVRSGDVLVLPAGTGHRRRSAAGGFTVVGAYPHGQEDYDLLREADAAARERIATLPVPPEDPVGGDGVASWR